MKKISHFDNFYLYKKCAQQKSKIKVIVCNNNLMYYKIIRKIKIPNLKFRLEQLYYALTLDEKYFLKPLDFSLYYYHNYTQINEYYSVFLRSLGEVLSLNKKYFHE